LFCKHGPSLQRFLPSRSLSNDSNNSVDLLLARSDPRNDNRRCGGASFFLVNVDGLPRGQKLNMTMRHYALTVRGRSSHGRSTQRSKPTDRTSQPKAARPRSTTRKTECGTSFMSTTPECRKLVNCAASKGYTNCQTRRAPGLGYCEVLFRLRDLLGVTAVAHRFFCEWFVIRTTTGILSGIHPRLVRTGGNQVTTSFGGTSQWAASYRCMGSGDT
jgi:hypothetical protein